MKRIIVSIAMCILAAGFLPQAARADLILYPSDDTWVDSDDPEANMDDTGLQIKYSKEGVNCIYTRRTYLRFDLSTLPVDIGIKTFLSLYLNTPPAWYDGQLALWSTGDDWNGIGDGPGDEATLVDANAPDPTELLATVPVDQFSTVVEFLSTALRDYINQERNGDGIASFIIQWASCPQRVDSLVFEDREDTFSTGQPPHIYPFSPTAISLRSFTARGGSAAGLTGLLIAASAAVVMLAGLYRAAEGVRRRLIRKSK